MGKSNSVTYGMFAETYLNEQEIELFSGLACSSATSANDNSGLVIYANSMEKPFIWWNDPENSASLINYSQVQEILSKEKIKVIMGFSGCVFGNQPSGDENYSMPIYSHPVIGMGCILMDKEIDLPNENGLDSERVFNGIAEYGLSKTINQIGHNGAYALSWLDLKSSTLSFFRNRRHNLYFSDIFAGSTVLWSTKAESIPFASIHSGIETDEIKLLKPYTLVRISLDSLNIDKDTEVYDYEGFQFGPIQPDPVKKTLN